MTSYAEFKIIVGDLISTKTRFMSELHKIEATTDQLRDTLTIEKAAKLLIATEKMKLNPNVNMFQLWDIKKNQKECNLPAGLQSRIKLEKQSSQEVKEFKDTNSSQDGLPENFSDDEML